MSGAWSLAFWKWVVLKYQSLPVLCNAIYYKSKSKLIGTGTSGHDYTTLNIINKLKLWDTGVDVHANIGLVWQIIPHRLLPSRARMYDERAYKLNRTLFNVSWRLGV